MRISREQWPQLIWLVVLGALGVALLMVGGRGGNVRDWSSTASPSPQELPAQGLAAAEESLEARLEAILGQIEGAGEVRVRVTLARGPVYDYAVNTNTNERRVEEGGERENRRVTTEEVAQQQLVMRQVGASQEPVVVQESRPAVQGVLVLARGGNDPLVRARLIQAVQTLLGVAAHQVAVLPMNGSGE
ncbi:MAG: hypothetical protein ACPLPT_02300 [Moorellales bacterium]